MGLNFFCLVLAAIILLCSLQLLLREDPVQERAPVMRRKTI